jgi:hypothetical protein
MGQTRDDAGMIWPLGQIALFANFYSSETLKLVNGISEFDNIIILQSFLGNHLTVHIGVIGGMEV